MAKNTTPRHTKNESLRIYKEMSDAELIVERDKLRQEITKSHRGINRINPQLAKNYKKNIARINTLLNQRRGYS